MELIHQSITVSSMSYERGWPFSVIDLLRDLQYDVSQHGFLRGIPAWTWGQASRVGEIFEASRAEGRNEARAQRSSGGWGWNMLRGWHLKMSPGIPTGLAVLAAFIWFYLRLLLLLFSLLFFVAIAPLYAVLGMWSLFTGGSVGAVVVVFLFAALGGGVAWWLQSSDAEARPAVS
jgi:hypothetical protein